MTITRRHALATLAAAVLFAGPAVAHAETIRIGLPTKTYWPTTVAEAAKSQKLFEKEGITAELTIYRGGAETFEAMAAGAADLILTPVAAGRRPKKGVMSKVVANGAMGNFGWQLMVLTKSPLDVKDLNGKKVGITSAGSARTCWRCGRFRKRRSISPACRSAAAALFRICSRATSTPPWCIRR